MGTAPRSLEEAMTGLARYLWREANPRGPSWGRARREDQDLQLAIAREALTEAGLPALLERLEDLRVLAADHARDAERAEARVAELQEALDDLDAFHRAQGQAFVASLEEENARLRHALGEIERVGCTWDKAIAGVVLAQGAAAPAARRHRMSEEKHG